MRIKVFDVTKHQQQLLDQMWQIDTAEELEAWARTLTPAMYNEVMVLEEMLMLSIIDNEVEKMDSFPQVMQLIKNIC